MRTPTPFTMRVYDLVRSVPRGRVATYGTIATLIYSPRAARAVGQALKLGLWGPDSVPWQRIINAQGRISFRGDLVRAELQDRLLRQEGVEIAEDGTIDLERFGWWGD